jgi:hypothetical protein
MKKNISLLVLLFVFAFALQAQTPAPKFTVLSKSPAAVAYYPNNFAHDRGDGPKKAGNTVYAKIVYFRPAKKEREVFGKLVPFNQVWRTGANENTEIKFYSDVVIQGKNIKAGTYSLFTIPTETDWTIILNSDLDAPIENFTIQFSKTDDKTALMQLTWDSTLVELPMGF